MWVFFVVRSTGWSRKWIFVCLRVRESICGSFLFQTIEVKAVQVCNSHEVMCCFYEWLPSLLSMLWLSQAHWWDTSSFTLALSCFQTPFCPPQMFLHFGFYDLFSDYLSLIVVFSWSAFNARHIFWFLFCIFPPAHLLFFLLFLFWTSSLF